jgi:succinate dehydrogenase / fumarate reductase flavoprotein subunit
MQGLADGYFVIPYTIGAYLSSQFGQKRPDVDSPAFQDAIRETRTRVQAMLDIKGKRSVDSFHRELGLIIWDKCGMARNREGLTEAIAKIPELREEFWKNVCVLGSGETYNQSLEKAGRVADFLEFGELMCRDALDREESCGGHFRTEYQTPDGEALRNDDKYAFVSAWKYEGEKKEPTCIREPLVYEEVKLATRSYK